MTEEAFPRQQVDLKKHLTNSEIHERATEAEESTKINEVLRTVNLNDDQIKIAAEQQVHKAVWLPKRCDESTDISTLNQFITFVGYVDSNRVIRNKFMEIRSLGDKEAKALKLLDKFKSMIKDKECTFANIQNNTVNGNGGVINGIFSNTSGSLLISGTASTFTICTVPIDSGHGGAIYLEIQIRIEIKYELASASYSTGNETQYGKNLFINAANLRIAISIGDPSQIKI
ncbi:MAG: hypothetical protein EZS28_014464 [Streblomastix strix]|uniref:Uncharacterized protein n=1 Tax=Streblomastix strix TaxID=222440 RepID=A0A5J4W5H9_9EUKA|nr:MAG: hypothetical protein EZS28_014464 [Streblomastix strix]